MGALVIGHTIMLANPLEGYFADVLSRQRCRPMYGDSAVPRRRQGRAHGTGVCGRCRALVLPCVCVDGCNAVQCLLWARCFVREFCHRS